jgi:uncharacterized protein (DUF433 family)
LALVLRDGTGGSNFPSMQKSVISRNPDVMGGAAVFSGTRVPVQTLLDYLEAGESIDDFLEGFPSVTREQIIAFLEQAKDRLIEVAT